MIDPIIDPINGSTKGPDNNASRHVILNFILRPTHSAVATSRFKSTWQHHFLQLIYY
jgi:hypothetical protein